MNSDEIRHKLVENFEAASPVLNSYYEYAQRAAALSEEYHAARLSEAFQVGVEPMILVAELDARETPKSLDKRMMELGQAPIKKIIFDQSKFRYYLFA